MCYIRACADTRRLLQARIQPKSHAELVEYLLSTEQPEMEYETARCRPLMTQDFMEFLQEQMGAHLLLRQCTCSFNCLQHINSNIAAVSQLVLPISYFQRCQEGGHKQSSPH